MSKKPAKELRVIEDNDRYRMLSAEHLSGDEAATAMALHFKKKFRRNIQIETGRYVALKDMRVEHYSTDDAQAQQLFGRMGRLPRHMTGEEALCVLLPYAVSGGRVYVSEDAFMTLSGEQKRDFIETKVRPWLAEVGIDYRTGPRVHLIPNRPV